jgi:hypothetical protein
MPVSANNKISVSDYSAIRNIIIPVMGSGSGSIGYGQAVQSVSRSENQKISQADWDNLRYDIINARIHQTGSAFTATTNASNSANRSQLQFSTSTVGFLILGMAVFGISPHPITAIKFITAIQTSGSNTIITLNAPTESVVSSGTVIYFGPGSISDFNVDNKISASAINSYESLGNTASDVNQRFLVAAGKFSTTAASSVARTWSSSTSPQFWANEINTELTVAFSAADQARWFFNSGGEIRISSTRTGGRSDQQNNDWSSLLSGIGVRLFGAQIPITGFSPMNGQNFYRLTNSYQTYFSQASSSPYADNVYQLRVRCNVADNSSGTANIVFIQVRFIGGYVDPGDNFEDVPRTNDEIDGTFTVTATQKYASGTLLPSGNWNIALPTYTFSAISGT